MGNSAFLWPAVTGMMGLAAIRTPQAVYLVAGTQCAGLKTGGVPFRCLDRSDQVAFFHFAGFEPHLLGNTLNLFYRHVSIPFLAFVL